MKKDNVPKKKLSSAEKRLRVFAKDVFKRGREALRFSFSSSLTIQRGGTPPAEQDTWVCNEVRKPVKLTDLNPKWIMPAGWAPLSPPVYIGVSFDCPTHIDKCPTCGHTNSHRLALRFKPAIDENDVLSKCIIPLPQFGQDRLSGDTFDTLTLDPSVKIGDCIHCCITNGEIVMLSDPSSGEKHEPASA
jgi:hypothetical protein